MNFLLSVLIRYDYMENVHRHLNTVISYCVFKYKFGHCVERVDIIALIFTKNNMKVKIL